MLEAKVKEACRVLCIQSEFVDGTDRLLKLGAAVIVFGGTRFESNSLHYYEAQALGDILGKEGVPVITGGGPGIMEAVNRGCFATKASSVRLNIELPFEQTSNPYQNISSDLRYFFVRKYLFIKHAVGFLIFPGGYGTLDQFFEALTLVQTGKVAPFPIVLVGVDYWSGLVDWIVARILEQSCISEEELELFKLVDSSEEAAQLILRHIRTSASNEAAELEARAASRSQSRTKSNL